MAGPASHPFVARVYDPIVGIADWLFLEPHRQALLSSLEGRVLDIGSGTGSMLRRVASLPPSDQPEHLIGIEPDQSMRRRIPPLGLAGGQPVRVLAGIGEHLPVRSDSIDIALCAMVLCTVEDPTAVLEELARVIRPGGELRLLEHIEASGRQGQFQRAARPVWRRVAGGCRPDRATDSRLAAHSRFMPLDERVLSVGIPPIRPFLRGRYRVCG